MENENQKLPKPYTYSPAPKVMVDISNALFHKGLINEFEKNALVGATSFWCKGNRELNRSIEMIASFIIPNDALINESILPIKSLSVRAQNVIKNAVQTTPVHWSALPTRDELSKVRGCGGRTINEIHNLAKYHGFDWK